MKLKPLIFAVLSAAFVAPASIRAQTPEAAPQKSEAGQYVSGSTITATALLAERNLKSLSTGVTTQDGVVRLSGHVPTSRQIERAIDAATNVMGVKEVRSDLNLKTSAPHRVMQ